MDILCIFIVLYIYIIYVYVHLSPDSTPISHHIPSLPFPGPSAIPFCITMEPFHATFSPFPVSQIHVPPSSRTST
jgi:hypothetical protein